MATFISFTTTPRNFLSDLNSLSKIGATPLGALTDIELDGVRAALKDMFKGLNFSGSKWDTTASVGVSLTSGSLCIAQITV